MKMQNIFFSAVFLLCISHLYPMVIIRNASINKSQAVRNLCTHKDSLWQQYYEQAVKIGGNHCSNAYESQKICFNPICCKGLFADGPTLTYQQFLTQKADRAAVLRYIDQSSESRPAFVTRATKNMEELYILYANAYQQHISGGDYQEFVKVRDLVDHKLDCTFKQLEIVQNDTHNFWEQCKKFTFAELHKDAHKRQLILDALSLCKEELVVDKKYAILNQQLELSVKRADKILSEKE
jgi:hypothetical protein